MQLIALATDYDGTLAHDGRVEDASITALERLKASGRKLLMVTGRDLPDLRRVFDRLELFDLVVAENGSLLYAPEARSELPLAPEPPPELVAALRARNLAPLTVGRGIIATWEPNEGAVLDAIHELGLEWQIVFNKGAVMVLPPGVNKATGLKAALDELKLSPLNVVGVGDAENDHAFLRVCGCSVAVANALPAVKETADLVTAGDHGAGVRQVIEALLAEPSDLSARAARRRPIVIDAKHPDKTVNADGGGVLIAGSSGFGKSTLATTLIEKLTAQQFQLCILDPEGDYYELEGAIVLGDTKRPPAAHEALDVLEKPSSPPLVVNMLGLAVEDRPQFLGEMLAALAELRARTARPHWLLIDEAHHMLPLEGTGVADAGAAALLPAIYVTVHPDQMTPAVLKTVNTVLAVGPRAGEVIGSFCAAIGVAAPDAPPMAGDEDRAVLYWSRSNAGAPVRVVPDRPAQDLKRHVRKYAEGELGEDKSFYFRGPDKVLNLRAQNLAVFLQTADGVDDATWLHHLHRGDYARWFREAIKDDDMAAEIERVQQGEDAVDTRRRVREIVTRRYTVPAQL